MEISRHAFVSAVVYLGADDDGEGLEAIDQALATAVSHYEMICCYDGVASGMRPCLRERLHGLSCSAATVMHMGRVQGLEAAMNAGIDASVGDYVLEVDSLASFDAGFIPRAYAECMEGADVVMGEENKRTPKGFFFYPLFNRFSAAPYRLSTTSCSLASRRAINRMRGMDESSPYRKAAYAACGLTVRGIPSGGTGAGSSDASIGLAMDALALYTDAFYKVSFTFSMLMVAASLAELVYVVVIYLMGIPIGGWTTTMLAITFGFLGVFIVLTFILKLAVLSVRLQTGGPGYLIQDIEKLGR